MKKLVKILLVVPILALAVIVASCTKEGAQGPPGENGINGTNGTATCGQCHDSGEAFLAKVIQWEGSTHAMGSTFERNNAECAPCHTSMGFKEVIASGENMTTATISNPTPVNCYTCHKVHETYTSDDWALTLTDAVTMRTGDATYDMGASNLCAKCHQVNPPDPMPVVENKEDVTITSPYWGPHHGPQGSMMIGDGGYEIGTGYENSQHSTMIESGCKKCHMASAYGNKAGGHQMGMTYFYQGHDVVNKAGCTDCHTNPDNLDIKIEETKTEIDGYLTDLQIILMDMGRLDDENHIIPGTMPSLDAGAVYNYLYVLEDRSGGSHNYMYAKTLLTNTITALQ